ncbi:5-formyltetrahydrofolate cyclo-ligase [Siccirubricoccus sp. KC 17139]|uniref:5-formyltetrahydrofolate cyclo-ligase n=1 Tax=Siccirubricoccus soli TaxID=2899147 RepID=A0ABT1DC37_9PROT|nr:5-formyltetrahydrofolate cyclo-ligase [Siccirubricoccus soli]MCO6419503.1 5-formyltetrahydrofolate cyclo-ligase [Siccirubricoccus soli]MCP2685638.1 5-formyltetrahydrofolate cyclo-ligase [Siccirubricoccus soli]
MTGWEAVRAWRKAQRERLIARRLAATPEERAGWSAAIAARLQDALPPARQGRIIGLYWPFKGEYDPRPLMRALHGQGVRLALPVVTERARPLVFRAWWPGIRMAPGIWNIPVPAEGGAVLPEMLIAPLVGHDGRGYRLGYGGGYYDRTLAAMARKPLTIGVGFELSRLESIHPQPHDIPMDMIVTERRCDRTGTVLAEPASPAHGEGASRP